MQTFNIADLPKFQILTEKVSSGQQNLCPQETPALYKYLVLGYPLSRECSFNHKLRKDLSENWACSQQLFHVEL